MSGNWIAVASAEHVRLGLAGGFMQVCHGKAAPLRRVKPYDWVVYYSPYYSQTEQFRGKGRLQAFTAIGRVENLEPYPFHGDGGFRPYRRDVRWLAAQQALIQPLLATLEFSCGAINWGYRFRLGLFAISDGDRQIIARAMGVPDEPNRLND